MKVGQKLKTIGALIIIASFSSAVFWNLVNSLPTPFAKASEILIESDFPDPIILRSKEGSAADLSLSPKSWMEFLHHTWGPIKEPAASTKRPLLSINQRNVFYAFISIHAP